MIWPSGFTGSANPVLVAVTSTGDAWIANLNTVGSTAGSLVKIQNSGCTGTTSTSVALTGTWASGATSPDGCVVQYTVLDDNLVTISAIAVDGADNLWVRPNPRQLLLSTNQRRWFENIACLAAICFCVVPCMLIQFNETRSPNVQRC